MGCLLKYFLASRHLFLGEKGYYVRALFPYGSALINSVFYAPI
ncbi:hypothetical protein ANAPC5_00978 [Anaplasma phagocytophilum]|nr:hypothetical protein ANAPC5_00978 [Anaplasma phagocytophilum]